MHVYHQLCSHSTTFDKDNSVATEDYYIFLKGNYEMKVNDVLFALKIYSSYFIDYFSLYSWKAVLLQHTSWLELRWETLEIGSRWGIKVKDYTEYLPAFLIANQTEFPLLEHKSSKTHMGETKPKDIHMFWRALLDQDQRGWPTFACYIDFILSYHMFIEDCSSWNASKLFYVISNTERNCFSQFCSAFVV